MGKVPALKEFNKCKVKSSWFGKLDSNGKPFRRWLVRVSGSNTHVLCTICNSKLSCEYKGFQAISQHAESVKHKKAIENMSTQLQLTAEEAMIVDNDDATIVDKENRQLPIPTLKLADHRDETTKAEIIWTMKNVSSNFSGKSCDDIGETLRNMFPNEPACKEFTLAHSKLSYMVSDCVGPHFRDIMLSDVKNSNAYYTLCFDETTNDASQKELQTSIRYYSETRKRIQEIHLETFFIENGKGKTIVKYLLLSLENAKLPIERLITISRDGPNVNKTVFRLINEEFKKKTGKNLVNVGSCDIHIIHNAFKKGLDKYGKNIADLSINLHYFFDGEALRSEEYRGIQSKNGLSHRRFLKHVPSRWLTLHDSTVRIIEEKNAPEEYFLKYLPKNRAEVLNSVSYKNVVKHYKSPTLKAEIYMVKESSELLQLYLKYLQVDEPLIHKLRDLLSEILLKILGRIAKPKTLLGIATITKENFDTKNLLPVDQVNLSSDIVTALDNCKDVEKAKFRLDYINHFKAIGLHILEKSCYKDIIVKCVSIIAPSRIMDVDSGAKIMKVADSVPFYVPPTLIDEWTLVQAIVSTEKLNTFKSRIDTFWNQFFLKIGIDNSKTFPTLSKVIQSVLSITHGSGGIERMISNSGLVFSEDKIQMALRTLNARLDIKYGLSLFFNNNHNLVTIDKEFIAAARRARQSYNLYLEGIKQKEMEKKKQELDAEKQRKQDAERLENIARLKSSLKVLENKIKEKEKGKSINATQLLSEANERLKRGILHNNLPEISLAQGMIEGAKVLITTEQEQTSEILQLKSVVEKRKSAIIDNYIKVTPRTAPAK